MPPGNRHEPRRAKSSSSDYSVTEFLRDFPDDNACLEHLWRTRYSRDGEHAHCAKCGSERVFKRYATKQQRQSWTCTGCGHHVHPTARTIFHRSSTLLRVRCRATKLMKDDEIKLQEKVEVAQTSWGGKGRRKLKGMQKVAKFRESKTTVPGMV